MRPWAKIERRIRTVLLVAIPFGLLAACATKSYELCDTPNCGDNVTIILDNGA